MGNYFYKPTYLDSLPIELRRLLLCYVPEEAVNISDFKCFQKIANDKQYWRRLYEEEFSKDLEFSHQYGTDFEVYFKNQKRWFDLDEVKSYYKENILSYDDINEETSLRLSLIICEDWEIKLDCLLRSEPKLLQYIESLFYSAIFKYCLNIVKYLITVQ